MLLQPLPLPFQVDSLDGFSSRLLSSHHANNYCGAVKRLNGIRADLAGRSSASTPGYLLNSLKREELIATNSMILHELYFSSLGGNGVDMEPGWELALAANFGSFSAWREEFTACAKALGGGSGWMLLTFQPREGILVNQWAADHTHAIAGGVPLLALDMYEHAYYMDFGAAAGDYVDAFMRNIKWSSVHARYQSAVLAASESLGCAAEETADALIIDVRRTSVFQKATHRIQGAEWRDPTRVADWATEVAQQGNVVVYCVHGHEVSRCTAMRLRAAGVSARYLHGGFERWATTGHPLQLN